MYNLILFVYITLFELCIFLLEFTFWFTSVSNINSWSNLSLNENILSVEILYQIRECNKNWNFNLNSSSKPQFLWTSSGMQRTHLRECYHLSWTLRADWYLKKVLKKKE
jgi:hypothetical protein